MKEIGLVCWMILLLAACSSEKLQMGEAKKTAESFIWQLDKGNYSDLSKILSDSYNASESNEKLVEKYKKLKDILGNVKKVQLTESVLEEKTGEESKVILTYLVTHDKLNSQEVFAVVKEGNTYKVADHSVESKN